MCENSDTMTKGSSTQLSSNDDVLSNPPQARQGRSEAKEAGYVMCGGGPPSRARSVFADAAHKPP